MLRYSLLISMVLKECKHLLIYLIKPNKLNIRLLINVDYLKRVRNLVIRWEDMLQIELEQLF